MLTDDEAYLRVYRSYLSHLGQSADSMQEARSLRHSGWRYFYCGRAPGEKSNEAAISAVGELVDKSHQSGWYALLSDVSLSASDLAERFRWLHGRLGVVTPQQRFRDSRIASRLQNPTVTRRLPTQVVLQFWAISPPETENPYKVVLSARPDKPLQVDFISWQQATGSD